MEIGFFLVSSLIGGLWCGYTAYLAWLKPEDFAKMYKDSSFVSDAKNVEEYIDSGYHLWLARIGGLFGTIICGFIFIMSVYSLVF